jgi:hypothetical protein
MSDDVRAVLTDAAQSWAELDVDAAWQQGRRLRRRRRVLVRAAGVAAVVCVVAVAGVAVMARRDDPSSVTAGAVPSSLGPAKESPAPRGFTTTAGWQQLRVTGGMAVVVSVAPDNIEGLSIGARGRVRDDVSVRIEGEKLIIERDSPPERSSVRVTVRVRLKELERVDASAGVSIDLGNVASSTPFSAHLDGGATVKGEVVAPSVEVAATGGTKVTLAGTADQLAVDASGGVNVDLEQLTARIATTSLESGARASVTVTERIERVRARGGAKLVYFGNPQLGTIDKDISSTVTPG